MLTHCGARRWPIWMRASRGGLNNEGCDSRQSTKCAPTAPAVFVNRSMLQVSCVGARSRSL
eukprot:6252337-Alexandrium_andersonii.AAC.1